MISAGVACVLGMVAVVGAIAPWFRFSFLSASVNIAGTSHYLDGRFALALAIVTIVVGGAAIALGPGHAARVPSGIVVVLCGLGGLGVMRHQGRHLKDAKALLNSDQSFRMLNRYFATHTTPTWGFWLEVAAFAAVVVAGLTVVATGAWRQSTRSAPPSTGMAHPDRYDAAGDSANAAT
jgi:hypothetical protein